MTLDLPRRKQRGRISDLKIVQVKNQTGLMIENILRLEYEGDYNSLVFYINNNLKVAGININTNERLMNYPSKEIMIKSNSDIHETENHSTGYIHNMITLMK